ncbi:hypothetical protein [Tropicimonas sediminicola]|uniref:hypothetical protein n=1 Tax=Tropicimonas sediminicola TaxID=1031541 RepID=UPI001130F916|nr:hypothetical protein [Tropicimonas sediminicola]
MGLVVQVMACHLPVQVRKPAYYIHDIPKVPHRKVGAKRLTRGAELDVLQVLLGPIIPVSVSMWFTQRALLGRQPSQTSHP